MSGGWFALVVAATVLIFACFGFVFYRDMRKREKETE